MSLPGFTAETSLYKTKKHYQDAGSFRRLNKAIYPAQWWAVEEVDIGSLDIEQPRVYGVVLPRMEEAFSACISKCRAGRYHPSYAACKRTCCTQFTNFDSCVIA